MGDRLRVGQIEVVALADAEGTFKLAAVLPGAQAGELAALRPRCPDAFADEATWRSNFGGYLVRAPGRTILVDTGIGPGPVEPLGGIRGDLAGELRRQGIDPDEVDAVAMTHLHLDHVGWNLTPDGRPTFPNARYLAPRADWELITRPDLRPHLPWVDRSIAPLEALGVLDLVEGETPLAEGVTALPTPGHTPGHTSVLVSSGGEGLLILGDVAPHPAQLTRPSWKFGADMDGDTAVTTRAQVLERVEAEGLLLACGHHPRPGFGRVVREDGGRYWRPL